MHDTFMWNWSKTSICDDTLFISSCINEAIANEINGRLSRRRLLSQVGSEIFHDSLMEPWWRHASFEIMWCTRLGSMVEKNPFNEQHDHYWQPRSLHLHQRWIPKVIPWCNILWHSNLYANWHNHFTHMDEYFWTFAWVPKLHGWKNVLSCD